MNVEPLTPDHLQAMRFQPQQEYLREFLSSDYVRVLLAGEVARTISIDGQPIACFGIATVPAIGRMLWCFFAEAARDHLVRLHRYARTFTAMNASPQLYATVEVGFAPGERLLRLLGFEVVGRLEAYGAHGDDHLLFLKSKGDKSCRES